MTLPANLAESTSHQKVELLAQGRKAREDWGLDTDAEGVLAVLLTRGYNVAESEKIAREAALQGRPMPIKSKRLQMLMTSVLKSRWADCAMEAQDTLVEIMRSGEEKESLKAAMTILDRAGHAARTQQEEGAGKEASVADLEKQIADLEKLFQDTSINGTATPL